MYLFLTVFPFAIELSLYMNYCAQSEISNINVEKGMVKSCKCTDAANVLIQF